MPRCMNDDEECLVAPPLSPVWRTIGTLVTGSFELLGNEVSKKTGRNLTLTGMQSVGSLASALC